MMKVTPTGIALLAVYRYIHLNEFTTIRVKLLQGLLAERELIPTDYEILVNEGYLYMSDPLTDSAVETDLDSINEKVGTQLTAGRFLEDN